MTDGLTFVSMFECLYFEMYVDFTYTTSNRIIQIFNALLAQELAIEQQDIRIKIKASVVI